MAHRGKHAELEELHDAVVRFQVSAVAALLHQPERQNILAGGDAWESNWSNVFGTAPAAKQIADFPTSFGER
jgi:hypothetical protein